MDTVIILSGLPHGSILGPLLFTMFINDLPSVLKYCHIHLFADDVQIYITSTALSSDELAAMLNEDLSRVLEWSTSNLLPVNPAKTKAMLMSRNREVNQRPIILFGNSIIEYVDNVTTLGFVLQSNLEWEGHINAQCSKIYRGLRVLRITSNTLPISVKLKLFKSLLLPHFVYGDVLLLNASAIAMDRLRKALNSCVRYVFNLSRFSRVSHLQSHLLGCRFQDFHKIRSCSMLFKLLTKRSPKYLYTKLHSFQNSRNRNFLLPRFCTSHYRNTLFVQGIVFWNHLPSVLKNMISVSGFRQECAALFNSQYQQ